MEIDKEHRKQKDFQAKKAEIESHFLLVRAAFQHVNEVLKEIGKPLAPSTKVRSSVLALPLLKFSSVVQKSKPPEPFEEDGNSRCL